MQAFELLRDVKGARDQRIAVALGLQPRLIVHGPLERNRIGRILRHQFAQPVDLAVRHLQHPADVAQHAARLQRPKRDDLRHALAAVTLLHVLDDLVAPLLTEVDVEVRHGDALGIEEALEDQPEADRIEIGDGQRVGDQRPGARAAAGADRNSLRLGPLDEIGDDQKVTGVFHADDDAELVLQPLLIFVLGVGMRRTMTLEPRGKPAAGGAAQLFSLLPLARGIVATFGCKPRQDRRLRARAERAALGDLDGGGKRLRQVGEQRRHFGAALEAMLGGELPALAVGDELAFGDAQQRIVRLVILARGKERLVGCDQRNPVRVGEVDQRRLRRALGRQAVTLQFDIKPVAKQLLQRRAAGSHQRALPACDRGIKRPARPSRQRDEPRGLAGEPIELDVRTLLLRRIEIGARAQPHQAAVALLAGGQQHNARKGGNDAAHRPVPVLLIGEIERERAANDRLDAGAGQLFGKLKRTEHVVGVGERQCRLPILLGEFSQPRDRYRALKQRIGRMNVQMHEPVCSRGSHCSVVAWGDSRQREHDGSAARLSMPAPCARTGTHSPTPGDRPTLKNQMTPSTCAHTAMVAKNSVIEAKANASPRTVRTMIPSPP